MDLFKDRIARLEENLNQLFANAGEISRNLEDLKSKLPQPEPEAVVSQTPPPLPIQTVPEPEPVPFKFESTPPKEDKKVQKTGKPTYNKGLELQLGRVWFVRIGIILLTTGLVFLSSYTYHNYVRDLGPGTRLGLFYLFSILITGAGLFCEGWKDSLKNYGRIVAAGGLATIYYCSFAAYHVEALKVIQSPVVASLLLTASAGLFCGVSLWKQSRLMLSTSLGLAFYSVSINPNGIMVCVSSLVLAAFGIIMMKRTRWMATGFVVLIGSYLSFAWWQLTIAHSSTDTQIFLVAYWLLFVAASLMPKQVGDENSQQIFNSINHSAFFLLFSLNLKTLTWINHHWVFCLVLGVALVAIALLGRSRLPESSILLHLTKGVGLITLGISLKLTGHVLFLTLLVESILLLAVCLRHPHPLARLGSQIIAALALGCALYQAISPANVPTIAWTIAAGLCLVYSILDRLTQHSIDEFRENIPSVIFTLLAFAFVLFGSTAGWSPEHRCILMALPGIFVPLGLRHPKLSGIIFDTLFVSMMISPIALVAILGQDALEASIFPVATLIALATSVLHTCLPTKEDKIPGSALSGIHLALATIFLAADILLRDLPQELLLIVLTAIPLVGTLVSLKSKLLIHSSIPAFSYLALFAIGRFDATLSAMGTLIFASHFFILRKYHTLNDKPFLEAATYLLTSGVFLLWILEAFAHPLPLITWTATAILLIPRFVPKILADISAAGYFLIAIPHFLEGSSSLAAYLAIIAPVALHLWHGYKKLTPHFNLLAIGCLLALWIQVTKDNPLSSPSAAWALTGTLLLLTGLFFRSRVFRLSALLILLASLGHVMVIDIINLDPLPRILSFITLGLGLLGLGFVYNRWQERLKQIL